MPAPRSDPRFRSFAERYLVTRSAFFRVGFEVEDAWKCMLDAKTIYKMGARLGHHVDPDDLGSGL